MSLEQKIKNEIAEILGIRPEKVFDDARFIEDLGANSLDKTEFIIALEANYNIRISGEQANNIIRVRDAIKFVSDRLAK